MKRYLAMTVAVGALMTAAWAQNASLAQTEPAGNARVKKQTINQRKENQQQRIGQGVETGSLTAAEAAKLERREAQLNKEEQHMTKTGDGLSDKEKARLTHQQNQLSKQIYRQKHDAQKQSPAVGEVEKRDRAQQKRIGEGIQNGSLNAREAAKLETKEAKLQREERRMRNGEPLSSAERAKVNRQQNRLSKDIYRQKHDAQRRH